ncbi:MAG: hypothetical protein HC769_19910 [Cyanobacteria bacterium CRU_2_1]|nr:hypothetical protein [Cyanobacteria bacterium RU_5_0]NJR60886.1 hypothetical protein [Cyanobacteria bacterium CRU_2_1]
MRSEFYASDTAEWTTTNTPKPSGGVLRTKPKAPIHPAITVAEQFWKEQQPVDT